MTNNRKLFSLDDYRKRHHQGQKDESRDPELARLAHHMHRLRESIPVNQQLKHELKQKLLDQSRTHSPAGRSTPVENADRRSRWRAGIFFLVLLLLTGWVIMTMMNDRVTVTDADLVANYEPEDGLQMGRPISISADGERILLEKNGRIEIYTEDVGWQSVWEDAYGGRFHSPAWANEHDQAAVIYEEGEKTEIWMVTMLDHSFGSRLLYRGEGVRFNAITWSKDDEWLMVTGDQEREGLLVHHTGTKHLPLTEWASSPEYDRLEWPKREDVIRLDALDWPREIEARLKNDLRYHLDWNKERNRLALFIEDEDGVSVWKLRTNE